MNTLPVEMIIIIAQYLTGLDRSFFAYTCQCCYRAIKRELSTLRSLVRYKYTELISYHNLDEEVVYWIGVCGSSPLVGQIIRRYRHYRSYLLAGMVRAQSKITTIDLTTEELVFPAMEAMHANDYDTLLRLTHCQGEDCKNTHQVHPYIRASISPDSSPRCVNWIYDHGGRSLSVIVLGCVQYHLELESNILILLLENGDDYYCGVYRDNLITPGTWYDRRRAYLLGLQMQLPLCD